MLKENEDVIAFYPGSVTEGNVILGKIVVHDRLKVEANILPRYFNHSSFASLRRQLNYFCFTRMGKGRQRGATYCNDGVIVMDDILRLKRRSAPGGATPVATGKRERTISPQVVSTSDDDENVSTEIIQTRPPKKSRPTIISPRSSPVLEMEQEGQGQRSRRISLDLTLPTAAHLEQPCLTTTSSPHFIREVNGEDDVIAGCHALLSFSRSSAGALVA
jgi:hypothetical protein